MGTYPMLNLNDVVPDPELVGQVPHALALYYLALPLAREDGHVSVAMAHPENTTALATLSCLLGASIVPVRGVADAIRSALQTLRPSPAMPAAGVLGWSARPEWAATVAAWTRTLGTALDTSATLLVPAQTTLDACLSTASRERYKLTVLGLPPDSPLANVLGQAAGPLLVVRGAEICPLHRILVVLRGFSSDEQVLDWAISLVQETDAALTLLPLAGGRTSAWQEVLEAKGLFRKQLESCLRRPGLGDLRAYLKVRDGNPAEQIGAEAVEGDYDLILISAEGEGKFVNHALAELERRNAHDGRPVLILKPLL